RKVGSAALVGRSTRVPARAGKCLSYWFGPQPFQASSVRQAGGKGCYDANETLNSPAAPRHLQGTGSQPGPRELGAQIISGNNRKVRNQRRSAEADRRGRSRTRMASTR